MKHLPAILCLSFFLAQSAAAQTIDGPFSSRQDLVNYWNALTANSSQAVFVTLNASVAIDKFGFGPAFGSSYFVCADGWIRRDCNSLAGPFLNISSAAYYVNSYFGGSPNSYIGISLDGASVQIPFSPALGNFAFVTCYGENSSRGLLSYVTLSWGFYGNYNYVPGIACLARP